MLFSTETTEGFTAAEIEMLNRVAERVFAAGGDELESYSVSDAVMSEFTEGRTEAELEAAVRNRLGIA